MKRDTSRKAHYEAKLHERKNMLHVHVSKELRTRLGTKARAVLVNKGDNVKIMRGTNSGKNAKVAKVNYQKLKIYLEGVSRKNAKGTEVLIPFHPSNLLLTDLNMTKDRKEVFKNAIAAPAKAEQPKAAAPKDEKPAAQTEVKA